MNTDLERLKSDISIVDLITRSGLTVIGKGPTLTTAEHDSLKIFTNNNSWTWYSQSGRQGKALGGSVIDWYMHHYQCNVEQAIQALSEGLTGSTFARAAQPPPQPAKVKQPDIWQSPAWQTEARAALELAQDVLWNLDDGAPGRAELDRRGIREDMRIAWGLGFGQAWNAKAGRKMPAIWIPYMNRQITAIVLRFIGVSKDDKSADRFGMWSCRIDRQSESGKRFLCGLHLNMQEAEPGQLGTLFVVEAELNAVSIFQVLYGKHAADVISFGSQSNLTNPEVTGYLATIVKRYKRVIVWTDEAEIALKGLGNMPNTLRCLAIRSTTDNTGVKLDANELLQRGELSALVFEMIKKVSV